MVIQETKKSPAYSFIKERIEREFQQLEKDKITPWVFFLTNEGLHLTDFLGKKITYVGMREFEGSPRIVFWKGFIQPFLNDIVSRIFSETENFCREKELGWKLPLEETALLLKDGISRVYSRMADIDQRLRGKGYPNSVSRYNLKGEMAVSMAFVHERLTAMIALQPAREKKKLEKGGNMDNLDSWSTIAEEFGITKKEFGRKINFVKDKFQRSIIFRDIEHAYVLAKNGFSKPSVILSGAVIEELLRQYLIQNKIKPLNNTFDEYIKTCQNKGLLKKAIHSLSDSVRCFRNIVHIENETSKRITISKATAIGAVSSIFTIANDF